MISSLLDDIREAAEERDYLQVGGLAFFLVVASPFLLVVFGPLWLLGRLIALVIR